TRCLSDWSSDVCSSDLLVQELVTARGEKWDVKIFATDVDKGSIEYAGRGLYPKSIAADVGPELLARIFVQESGALRICPEIRKRSEERRVGKECRCVWA